MTRARLRDLGITVGELPTGKNNAITDVPGVTVGHATLIKDSPRIARTGVTVIMPRAEHSWHEYVFAGYHAFTGNGELTGAHWLDDSGMLCAPLGITNTFQAGMVRDALIDYACQRRLPRGESSDLPIVSETYDGWLNDLEAFHLSEEHVFQALDSAASGVVAEGSVGGGTGMTCHEFKGGIGSASRLVEIMGDIYTLGVLVQTNYGERRLLRLNGFPVGQMIGNDDPPIPWEALKWGNSIVVILATDAPLLPVQCRRLARQAVVGFARVGGIGYNADGDFFLAFSTGNRLPHTPKGTLQVEMLPNRTMSALFMAAAEAVEEAIWNSMTAAETMSGFQGQTAYALPLDRVVEIVDGFQGDDAD
jgi:D-aminopeptidase